MKVALQHGIARIIAACRNVLATIPQSDTPQPRSNVKRHRILFLAANPANTPPIRLGEEARDIAHHLRVATHRDAFDLETRWAVRPDDVLLELNEHSPTVVHFSGHGDGAPGILLQDAIGNARPVDATVLRQLFKTMKGQIRIVVLNACFSDEQAEAIAEVIDIVVGMRAAIDDGSARRFAAAFYRGLAFGATIENAFDQGRLAIALDGLPDECAPILRVRSGVDPTVVRLVA
ncbi:MAG: CHAT domain-containing protein [Deltaproteobacteria bacterium]|nr:CHAT domain-containing protein [Deltaproteobacteria bacterium]